jgi:EAL domain-containing protein (putative c-di-GMP-specific phosphodiesterase class I)/GGDEF domain-containing protein
MKPAAIDASPHAAIAGREALLAHLHERIAATGGGDAKLILLRLRKLTSIRDMVGEAGVGRILESVRERLVELVQPGERVAEMEPGTYGLVCDRGDATEGFAERAVAAISRPIALGEALLYSPANAGVCSIEDGVEAPTLLESAMRALERAMARGPGAIERVSRARDENAVADWEMRSLLEEAALRGQMFLEYQALHTTAGVPTLKLEGLLRWSSPALGRVSPERFVPLLEESGLVRTVGEWVLREACTQVRAWREALGLPVRIAVNVSPVQLTSSDFERIAKRVADETGCETEWIDLEVTEGAIVRDFPRMRGKLEALAAAGFRLVMDDFGAGYSSLGQLAQFPVHHLKMDKTLIAGIPEDARRAGVVKAVMALAEALSLGVTAEGVESARQAEWLSRFPGLACQGYLFSRPLPASAVPQVLRGAG